MGTSSMEACKLCQHSSKGQKCSYEEIKKGNIVLRSAHSEIIKWTKKAAPIRAKIKSERQKYWSGRKSSENQINRLDAASKNSGRRQKQQWCIVLHTHTHTFSTHTVRQANLPEWHPSPDTTQSGWVGFHGGGVLHHLEHRHHQEDDIDLSKQTRITVYRLHLNRRPVSGDPKTAQEIFPLVKVPVMPHRITITEGKKQTNKQTM